MEGKGIFDDLKRKGKKMVKKSVREGVDSLKENVGEVAGATLGTAAAGAATSVGLPTLAPLAGAAGYQLGKSLTESAAEKAEKEFDAEAAWMAIPFEEDKYSIYFGTLNELDGNKGISIRKCMNGNLGETLVLDKYHYLDWDFFTNKK